MEWHNPDGSVTPGVIVEDGAGNKITSFSGGGAGGANASVGATGVAAPFSATEIGFVDALGNLAPVGSSNPLPIAAATALATSDSGAAITGAAMPSGGSGLTGWLSAIWSKLSGTLAVAWSGSPNVTVANSSLAVTGTFYPATQPVSASALPLPAGAATSAAQTGVQTTTTAGAANRTLICDSVTGQGALVTAFHNADNLAIGGTSYGIMTGGVAQLVNSSGNLDRQREAYADAMAVTGFGGSIAMVLNGSGTWDRPRSAAAAQATTGTGVAAEAAFGAYTASLPTLTSGQYSALQLDVSGRLIVSALPTGANLIGAVNLDIGGATLSQSNPVPTTETYSNVNAGQVSLTSSATLIVAARPGRKEVTIVNNSTTMLYLGGSGVTTTTGLLLAGVTGEGVTISGGAAIYGVVASGSEPVSFLEVY
jgi:hypothetical protein